MSNNPTTEQLYALSDAYIEYEKEFIVAWKNRTFDRSLDIDEIPEKKLTRDYLIEAAIEAAENAEKKGINNQIKNTREWLINQPAFAMAANAVGFKPTSMRDTSCRFIPPMDPEECFCFCLSSYQYQLLGRALGDHLQYTAGVARAYANYLSKVSVKRSTEGMKTLEKMQNLAGELQDLIFSDPWFFEDHGELARSIKSISRRLDTLKPQPVSRRQDSELAARLMAAELIELHYERTRDTSNRAVFQLMGLPGIDKPLEIRTIERLSSKWLREHRKHRAYRYERQKSSQITANTDAKK